MNKQLQQDLDNYRDDHIKYGSQVMRSYDYWFNARNATSFRLSWKDLYTLDKSLQTHALFTMEQYVLDVGSHLTDLVEETTGGINANCTKSHAFIVRHLIESLSNLSDEGIGLLITSPLLVAKALLRVDIREAIGHIVSLDVDYAYTLMDTLARIPADSVADRVYAITDSKANKVKYPSAQQSKATTVTLFSGTATFRMYSTTLVKDTDTQCMLVAGINCDTGKPIYVFYYYALAVPVEVQEPELSLLARSHALHNTTAHVAKLKAYQKSLMEETENNE